MSLTWHIVRKDLRRMALPVAAWVAFVAVAAIWFGASHMPADAIPAHELNRWVWGLGAFQTWGLAMQVVTSVLLAAHLLLDDAVVGTTAFWQTRPISHGRMLGAKLIAGGLLLVAAPTLALGPVWLASGFSMGELAMAAGEFAAWQIGIVVLALGFASLSRNLAQFFFAAAGVAVAFVLAVALAKGMVWSTNLGTNVAASRWLIAIWSPAPFMAGVLVHQFLTRRTRAGWLAVVVGVVATHAVQAFWTVDLLPYVPTVRSKLAPTPAREGDLAGAVTVKKIVTPFDRSLPHALTLALEGRPVREGFFAPEWGEAKLSWADKSTAILTVSHGGFWGEDVAKRIAGLKPDEGAVEWGMAAHVRGVNDLTAMPNGPESSGKLQFAFMHGRVLAELPLRAGAESSSGSSGIRIVGLGEGVNYDRPCVVVEERDSIFLREIGLTGGRASREADSGRRDCYLLVNRALGIFKCLHIVELGSVNVNSLLVSARQLEFSLPEKIENGKPVELPGWRDGAVLIKVRFELERRVVREVTSARVALVTEEEKK